MKIYTGYHANIKKYKAVGLLTVSVSQGNPRGEQPEDKLKELCPTWDMVKKDYTEKEYQDKILKGLNPNKLFYRFKDSRKDIVLLCFEKDPKDCHRSLIKNWLNKYDIFCEEFKFAEETKTVEQKKLFE